MYSAQHTHGRQFGGNLLLVLATCGVLLTAGVARAEPLYAGGYTITVMNSGAIIGPVVFDAASGLGDGAGHTFGNGNNELGGNGVEVVFDLEAVYAIDGIKTFHSNPNQYWGVGVVDFYISDDGDNWELLGSDGVVEGGAGLFVRRYEGAFESAYVKVHVRSRPWYNLSLARIELEVTPEFLPVSQIRIDGLEGARHFIWLEAETAEFRSGFARSAPYASHLSGFKSTEPFAPSCLRGDYNDHYGYSSYSFHLPADMADATYYTFYASYYEGRPHHVFLNDVLTASIAMPGTGQDSEYASRPKAWTPAASLGSLSAGGHDIRIATGGSYNEDSYDGFLITDGPAIPGGIRTSGVWSWRDAPTLDPNTAIIGGDSITATITVSGPVAEGFIRVDGYVVESFSDAGVFEVTVTGGGNHALEVETFAYPYDPCSTAPLRGRVLAGASFHLAVCGSDGVFLPGDFNQDCYIDLADFSMLANNWLLDTWPDDPNAGGVLEPDPAPTPLPRQFPLGWYTSINPVQLPQLAADGFNCVAPYGARWGFLNVAHDVGIGVFQYISGSGDNLTDFINEYKQSPAIWYWNLYDEPIGGGNPQPLAQFAANYNTVKAADPQRLVTAVFCVSNIGNYMNYVDFPMFDRYPIGGSDPIPSPNMYRVASETKSVAQQAAAAGKAAPIFVAQAMGGYSGGYREPTFAEQRYMVFAPLTVGAEGIIFYSRFDITAEHYLRVVEISAQVAALVPALESPLGAGGLAVTSSRDSDTTGHGVNDITYAQRMVVEQDATYVYLIAVNNTGSAVNNVIFTLGGLPAGNYTADVLYEDRSINLVGNTLTDNFPAWGVHIYKFAVTGN